MDLLGGGGCEEARADVKAARIVQADTGKRARDFMFKKGLSSMSWRRRGDLTTCSLAVDFYFSIDACYCRCLYAEYPLTSQWSPKLSATIIIMTQEKFARAKKRARQLIDSQSTHRHQGIPRTYCVPVPCLRAGPTLLREARR